MGKRPVNFLFFLPDQHRGDWLGGNENLPLRTPNLDGLSSRGVRFTNAFCTSPLCGPSRACLASGKSYDRCGVVNNSQDYPLDQPTYYQALRDVGYRVAGVGKFDLHKPTLDWNLDGSRLIRELGFTEGIDSEGKLDGSKSYRESGAPMGPYLAFLEERGLAELYVREHAERRRSMNAYITALPEDAYCDNWVAENGLEFLRRFPEGRPWHLVVNFTGPHSPMEVTASAAERWADVKLPPPHENDDPDGEGLLRNRRYYAAMIEDIDRHVGRFVDLVGRRGELENTIIVYASDHGEMLGDHGLWEKSIHYQPSVGVPLIIAGPGVDPDAASGALVSLHDLAATFVDYAGAAPMPGMDAVSLRGLLEGRRSSHREYVISGLEEWRMVFDGRYKLVLFSTGEDPILFDLEADPTEDVNIAARNEQVVARLRGVLAEECGFS